MKLPANGKLAPAPIATSTNSSTASAAAVQPARTRQPTAEERRRSQRVLLRMTVLVHLAGEKKPLQAETHTVSQNGATILLPESLMQGTRVTLENPQTDRKVDAQTVRVGQIANGGSLVPFEFSSPAPDFWAVFFPPALN